MPVAPWLSIVGIGEEGIAGLGPEARTRVSAAELVVGGRRHLDLAATLITGRKVTWPSPPAAAFPEIFACRGRPVAVLASGDPFHYGIGGDIARLAGIGAWVAFPQPSAFSLAANRLGWLLQDVTQVSVHGRPLEAIIRHLQPGARIFALSWDGATPARLARLLVERGCPESPITVLEALGGPRERITTVRADAFDLENVDPLNTLAIEVIAEAGSRLLSLAPGRDDDLFENDGQLTKRPFRALAISSLAPRRGDLLWDIGLGSASIAIEWLLCDPTLRAVGVEKHPARAERARCNATAFGVPSLQIVTGRAPDVLANLPQPDAIFVGGGLTEPGLLDILWDRLKPGGRLVANAVTLETEALLLDASARLGGELLQIASARAEAVGPRRGWRPSMPIIHWRVTKPC